MYKLNDIFENLNKQLKELTSYQEIKKYNSVKEAVENAYKEVNKWNQVDEAIVVFSDLKNSTGISFDKQKRTITKLLEYLNKPFIEIHQKFGAEFIDIKGDGGLAIYSKDKFISSLLASITVKTFYAKYIQEKVKKNIK